MYFCESKNACLSFKKTREEICSELLAARGPRPPVGGAAGAGAWTAEPLPCVVLMMGERYRGGWKVSSAEKSVEPPRAAEGSFKRERSVPLTVFLQPRSAAWSECRVSREWEVSRSGGLSGKEDGKRGGQWEGWEVIRDPGGWSCWGGDAREASRRGEVRVSVCGPGFAGMVVAERDKVRCRGNGLSWGRTRSWGEGA